MKQALASRIKIVAWALTVILAGTGSARAAEIVPPLAHDLRQDAIQARALKVPIMLIFVSDQCGYCKRVLDEFVQPLTRLPEYRHKVLMRRIQTSTPTKLRDFDGSTTTHGRFAVSHDIYLVPTIAFFDANGEMAAKPMVGLSTPDYYGYYLDQRIDQALAKIRGGP